MKPKTKMKLPFLLKIILIIVLILILAAGGLVGKMRYEQGMMQPLPTGETIPGIYAINDGFVNIYLVRSGNEYLMIDAGNRTEQVKTGLEELGIAADAVKVILLTHSDYDHIAALSLFPDARIYLPEAEVQMLDGTVKRSPMGYNHLEYDYTTVADGEELDLLGLNIRCISTPGHTPGSMSFLLDNRSLFTGDTMRLKDGNVILFNSFYNMDDDRQGESIRKLAAETQAEYLFTAHYGYSEAVEEAFADWR